MQTNQHKESRKMKKRGTCSKQKNKVKLQNMFKGTEYVIYLTEFKIKGHKDVHQGEEKNA